MANNFTKEILCMLFQYSHSCFNFSFAVSQEETLQSLLNLCLRKGGLSCRSVSGMGFPQDWVHLVEVWWTICIWTEQPIKHEPHTPLNTQLVGVQKNKNSNNCRSNTLPICSFHGVSPLRPCVQAHCYWKRERSDYQVQVLISLPLHCLNHSDESWTSTRLCHHNLILKSEKRIRLTLVSIYLGCSYQIYMKNKSKINKYSIF